MNRDFILLVILCRHEGIVANFHVIDFAGAVVSNDVLARHIGIRKRALGAGHVLTIHIDRHLVIVSADFALALQLTMNEGVELDSLSVTRRNNERTLGALAVSTR